MEYNNTAIFWKNIDQMSSQQMSPQKIVDFLEKGAIYRTFSDVLHAVYPYKDLEAALKKGLYAAGNIQPGTKEAESMDRNIRNWCAGRNTPQSRDVLFRICFALGLDEVASSKLLACASETGIHYRDPKELIYAFGLRTGLTYTQAVQLDGELAPIYEPLVRAAAKEREAYWKQWEQAYREKRRQEGQEYQSGKRAESFIGSNLDMTPSFLTQQVSQGFACVTQREELEQFLRDNGKDMGIIHESAYEKFRMLLLTLAQPDDWIAGKATEEELDSGTYSLEKIMDIYLRMIVPKDKKTKDFSYLQKAIKRSWPDAGSLQKMRTRKMDVERKTLLLLFIVTEDYLFSEDLEYADIDDYATGAYVIYEDEDESTRDELEIIISKINMFLTIYGMNQLDPGNPFDCLVLYAIAAEYGSDSFGDPFSEALEALFQ